MYIESQTTMSLLLSTVSISTMQEAHTNFKGE